MEKGEALTVANGMWKEPKLENTQEARKNKRKSKLYSSSLLQTFTSPLIGN